MNGCCDAQPPYQPIATVKPVLRPAKSFSDLKALERCVDDAMAASFLDSGMVPGAVVAIVKDSSIVLAKGYGVADSSTGLEVDPGATLFRIGSLSKLFTATAAMQLVERGKLDLCTDVREYLDPSFKVPAVSLKNLLTHSAGFEENQYAYMVKDNPDDLVPLEQNLREHTPSQVRPATLDFSNDRSCSYSSWSVALVGLIVSRVARMSFDAYVKENILDPLGMACTTFTEPLPMHLAPHLARGHIALGDGVVLPQGPEYWHSIAPAGSACATACDMAKFMLAHLHGGQGASARILQPASADLMQSRLLAQHPNVNGMGLVFYEDHCNGRRMLCHRGKTLCFPSDLVLVPEEKFGIFVALNCALSSTKLRVIAKAVMDQYFEADIPDTPPNRPSGTAASYAGVYCATTHSYRKIEKFLLLKNPGKFESVATAIDDKTLGITNLCGGNFTWDELEPGVFRRQGGQDQVAFVRDDRERVSHMLGPYPFGPSRKVRLRDRTELHLRVLAVAKRGLQAAAAWASIAMLCAIVDGLNLEVLSPGVAVALGCAAAVGILGLVAFGFLWKAFDKPIPHAYPRRVGIALGLILLSIAFALAVVASVVAAWRFGYWDGFGRIAYTVVAVLEILFLLELAYWKLVGYRYA